jgi:hypothetical protein
VYELARVRLHSIGPRGARYQDVTLDLRSVGAAIARPAQDALFSVGEAAAETVRRPSPATVLFLENGGGKSVLIKLIFSVMLPGRRQVVGTTSTRVLEKFILGGDVAHVVLEWQHVDTGRLIVVGKVSQWRDHVVSTDPNRLLDAWYSFRPSAVFNLDALPFTEGGRLVSIAGFRDRLTNASKADPALEVGWETGQQLWTEKLDALGLDPELFAYQRRMNAGEGEAADAFAFRSDEAFLDWLLTAVTSEDDPRTLGDVVEGYATKLGQRDGLIAERDFVAGALDLLGPLAKAAAEAATAREIQQDVRREAEAFAAAALARRISEESTLNDLGIEATQADADDKSADVDRRRLNAVTLELHRHLAALRWQAAEAEKGRLDRLRDGAGQAVDAWLATDVVLWHEAARQRADQMRAVVGEQEQQAAPVLAVRNAAAKRLARGLLATAVAADEEAALLDAEAIGLDEDITQADNDAIDATRQAEQERGRASAAEERVAAVQADLQGAVDDGLLTGADEVTAAAEIADEAADAARAKVATAVWELTSLAERRKQLGMDLKATRQSRDNAVKAAAAAHSAHQAATSTAATLAGEERLAALLGTDQLSLDSDAPALVELLADAIAEAEAERTRLHMADEVDQRVLDALGTGGLLPPGADVTSALRVLEAERIPAWSGWHYLASTAPAERDRMLGAYPHLIDGLVINNADHLDRAEQVLMDAQLLPRSVVAVGTTADLSDLTVPAPAGLGFVVQPNPAMYDEARAEDERQAILGRQADRHARFTALTRQLDGDRPLRQRVADWRRDYPPGTVEELHAADQQAADDLAAVETRIEALGARIEDAETAEDGIRQSLPDLQAAEERGKANADRLAGLAAAAAKLPGLQSARNTARDAAAAHELDASNHRERTRHLRAGKEAALRKADDQRRIATSCRAELGQVPGGGAVDIDQPAPSELLDTLRGAYETAKDAYARVEVGADLRTDLTTAENDEAKSRAAVEGLDPDVRTDATDLLRTPDGADAAGRAAATDRARRTLRDAENRLSKQVEEVGALRNDYENRPAQEVTLEPYGRPSDVAQGAALVTRAQADRDEARRRYELVHARKDSLDAAVVRTQQTVDGFTHLLDALAGAVPEPEHAARPFDGTLDEARAARADVLRQLNEADAILAGSDRDVRRAADALASYASDGRFAEVDSPVRRQVTAVQRDTLPDYAAEWESALRPRLRSLNDDLAQINRHRATIITRLHGMVDQALGTLRAAQRLSRLPGELGDWSGQEFLRIRFTEPDRTALDERLGEVLDEAAAGARPTEKGGGKRDGLTLLLKGVRAAMQPKGVRVEMLKPDAVLRTERVRVGDVGDVFSGGQLLTAAIILYCTMAALRANERGHTRRPHAGVLFLDNPIGRASAGYLLELQLKVAAALGVQLIYTTGLFDTNALSVFPLIVRLRNDADLRAGLKYLNVDQAIRNTLAELPEADDETATVTATRVFARPAGRDGQAS